ncbi:xanthine dehydrogenase, molybdenum binding subunit apoprotein [Arboricoccus pini]|uniref:Xanthine dehydrogenase, molybdenum binding subunit apoprotein n=1 Tax=Arboricoccus pini TaxID=1963835 RepID=A0A212QCJ1_9PROT|nr:xanthine dehydrogenase molybdopterin binding subunit [Arboricoccus pini]SNB57030.1 xanthine dehydrogenase, molybdenum binding subunit apoprotein [Arboricoccus pini]
MRESLAVNTDPPETAPVHLPLAHDSARKHVTGQARYVDDIPLPERTLQVHIAWAAKAHARIIELDLSAVLSAPGVVAVVDAAGVPGINEISPAHRDDEPLFATERVLFHGQPLFAVAADDIKTARRAARLARIVYEDLPAVLDVDTAKAAGDFVVPPLSMRRGDAAAGLEGAPLRRRGRLAMGGQEHFYLEGQVALALPGEDGDMLVYSSTQHPTETQDLVARVLGLPAAAVTIEVRRLGGAFGGKESQANLFACGAAVVAARTGRPAKCRADRDDDMIMTGKRHDFMVDYEVGFSTDGQIQAVAMDFISRCGWSADLSGPINDRALFHADNGYFYPDVALQSYPCRTNTVSNTAFRGFGGPQGMLAAERLIDEIAFATGQDPFDVRLRNLYGGEARDLTPYHMRVEDNILPAMMKRLAESCRYRQRRVEIRAWNEAHRWQKRGLALTPVKFGISFTMTAFNQAGSLIHIYKDGSVHLNHGGIEMGQGLYLKVAQVVAQELALPLERIRLSATTTGKVPNTSATAASSGSDLNGMAALAAARTLKERLIAFTAEMHQSSAEEVEWLPGRVVVKGNEIFWEELVHRAYLGRVPLSATGFYKTPKIHWDREQGRGRPFYYFAYGAACAETIVDVLTGEHRVLAVQILHDCGTSLNPAIDKGQIEGGFVQGMGWLTSEELVWDEAGRLRTHAPSTYKIPTASDRPPVFEIELWDEPNREATIHRSKAVGEPPFMLALSVFHSLSDAVAAVADHRVCPRLDAPATPERVLGSIERLRKEASG